MWCLDPGNSAELMASLRPHWREPVANVAWVGEGWRDLVWNCHRRVEERFPNYELLAIKQKWGILAFQAFPAPWRERKSTFIPTASRELEKLLAPVIAQSERTCEWCGSDANLREGRELQLTLCDACDRRFSDPPRPGYD